MHSNFIRGKAKIVFLTIGLLLFIVFSLFLSSCTLFGNQRIILWTNQPEMAAYIEFFNSIHDSNKVEIYYKDDVVKALSDIKKHAAIQYPDIVMGYRLNSPAYVEDFKPLDKLIGDDKIKAQSFYENLLATGRENNKQLLLPVSFNLPALIFNRELNEKVSSIMITLDEFENLSKQFNKKQGNHLKKLGFSPFWNDDFIYYTAELFGNRFPENGNGNVEILDSKMQKVQDYIFNWINEINGGYENEKAFTEKYIHVPMYKLVDDKRILFALVSSKDILNIPEEKRKDLSFRWLSYNDTIPVEDDILYTGITARGENKKGAEIFLRWFFTPSVQKELININHFKRLNVFGICNGFSAFKQITEREIPKQSQIFLGHIPPSNFLLFPGPKPEDWDTIKKNLIDKWFLNKAVGKE